MKLLNLSVLVLCFWCGIALSQDHSDDFYWRDYNGEVPKDALPGGLDQNKNPTYIGQVVGGESTIIPGEIIGGVQKMYYQGDYSAREAYNNIKILCTHNPNTFEWVKSNGNDIRHIDTNRLIPGGYQYGDHIYIGRGYAGNVLAVGKVIIPNDVSRMGIFKAAVDDSTFSPHQFEVLTHRRTIKDSSAKATFLPTLALLIIVLLLL